MIRSFILFLSLLLSIQCKVTEVHHVEDDNIRIEEGMGDGDKEITKLIAPYKARMDSEMNEVIGTSVIELVKDTPESTMGNWFADAMMTEAETLAGNVDFAIQNRGGLRLNSIAPGPITKGLIYELMPFDNFLVIMETKGSVITQMMEHIANDRGWPVSKEIVMEVQDGGIKVLTIEGEDINDNLTYRWALPDYVANGGSDCSFLKSEKQISTGVMIRDVIINHIRKLTKKGETINSVLDGRMIIEKTSE